MGRLVQLDTVFTDLTLPKFYPNDALLNNGSLLLFDFARANSYTSGVLPTTGAAIANTTTLNNLVTGAPSATVSGNGFTYGTNGIVIAGNGNAIQLGNNYNLASLNPNFLMIIWIKQSAATAAYASLFTRGTTTTPGNQQYRFDTGADGLTMRAGPGGPTTASMLNFGSPAQNVLGTVYQLAMVRVGTSFSVFRNGVQTLSGTCDATLADPAVTNVALANAFTGTVYRAYMENLTVSGKSGAAQVAADYALNSSRFS